jgi:hypothetical protein
MTRAHALRAAAVINVAADSEPGRAARQPAVTHGPVHKRHAACHGKGDTHE